MLADDQLSAVLATGWEAAGDDYETPVSVALGDGLYARLGYDAAGSARMAVWRKNGQSSEAEADALAAISGMERWRSAQQGRYWIVEELEGECPPLDLGDTQEAEQAPEATATPEPGPQPLRGPVCGTCAHGIPDAYGDIECDLGWEAHDPPMYTSKPHPTLKKPDGKPKWVNEPATMAHPGVPFPLMTRNCRCMCREDSWTPRRRTEE